MCSPSPSETKALSTVHGMESPVHGMDSAPAPPPSLQHECTQMSLRKLSEQPTRHKSTVPLASAERVVQTTKVVAVAVSSYAISPESQIPRLLNRINTPENYRDCCCGRGIFVCDASGRPLR